MKLEILDENNELDISFGRWLVKRVQEKCLIELDTRKLSNWDKFFNEDSKYVSIYGKEIHTKDILISGIQTIGCDKIPEKIIIRFNQNQYVPGLDRVRVDTVCRMINFGNTSVTGYPLFTNVFSYFVDNINMYIDMYFNGDL